MSMYPPSMAMSRGRGRFAPPRYPLPPYGNRRTQFESRDVFEESVTVPAHYDGWLKEHMSTGINFEKYQGIPVHVTGENVPEASESFEEIGLREALLQNIRNAGYKKPTPVQKNALPIAMTGRDIMACAQTGSGKTAAFLLPILHRLLVRLEGGGGGDQDPPSSTTPATASSHQYGGGANRYMAHPLALILAPTRELAQQIHEEARKFAYGTPLRISVVYGGVSIEPQMAALEHGCNLLVACPGRLIDLIERRKVSVSNVSILVLDEADRMLDMGFEPQIRRIVEQQGMPSGSAQRQTLMFSATFPEEIQKLAGDFLCSDYVFVAVGRVGAATDSIQQRVVIAEETDKKGVLIEILRPFFRPGSGAWEGGLVLIFVKTKRRADQLARILTREGLPSTCIHGDRSQKQREDALRSFSTGRTPVLVATDVAARGLDIPHVAHVINFDLPPDIDDYVHRIGRTGRVGNTGIATALVSSADEKLLRDLCDLLQETRNEVPEWLDHMAPNTRQGSISERERMARRMGMGDGRGGNRGGGGGQQHPGAPNPFYGGGPSFGGIDYRTTMRNSRDQYHAHAHAPPQQYQGAPVYTNMPPPPPPYYGYMPQQQQQQAPTAPGYGQYAQPTNNKGQQQQSPPPASLVAQQAHPTASMPTHHPHSSSSAQQQQQDSHSPPNAGSGWRSRGPPPRPLAIPETPYVAPPPPIVSPGPVAPLAPAPAPAAAFCVTCPSPNLNEDGLKVYRDARIEQVTITGVTLRVGTAVNVFKRPFKVFVNTSSPDMSSGQAGGPTEGYYYRPAVPMFTDPDLWTFNSNPNSVCTLELISPSGEWCVVRMSGGPGQLVELPTQSLSPSSQPSSPQSPAPGYNQLPSLLPAPYPYHSSAPGYPQQPQYRREAAPRDPYSQYEQQPYVMVQGAGGEYWAQQPPAPGQWPMMGYSQDGLPTHGGGGGGDVTGGTGHYGGNNMYGGRPQQRGRGMYPRGGYNNPRGGGGRGAGHRNGYDGDELEGGRRQYGYAANNSQGSQKYGYGAGAPPRLPLNTNSRFSGPSSNGGPDSPTAYGAGVVESIEGSPVSGGSDRPTGPSSTDFAKLSMGNDDDDGPGLLGEGSTGAGTATSSLTSVVPVGVSA